MSHELFYVIIITANPNAVTTSAALSMQINRLEIFEHISSDFHFPEKRVRRNTLTI